MIPPRSLALAALALLIAIPSAADVATLTAGKDNTLFEDLTGSISNGQGSGLIVGRTAGFEPPGVELVRRALLWFDVASAVAAPAIIDSAFLTINVTRTQEVAGTAMNVHEVLADWGEGSSNAGDTRDGDGAQAQTGDATWIHRSFNTTFWSTPGGNFDPTPSATRTVAGIGAYTWPSSVELVADIQSWIDGVATNHGWMLIGDEVNAATTKRISSRESTTAANRPTLVIYYTPDMTPVAPTTWGAIKSLYR